MNHDNNDVTNLIHQVQKILSNVNNDNNLEVDNIMEKVVVDNQIDVVVVYVLDIIETY